MSRDYRYGHRGHKGFQRKSQQVEASDGKAGSRVWLVGVLLSLLFVGGFWVVDHFMDGQPKSVAPGLSEIYGEVNAEVIEPPKSSAITVEALQPVPRNHDDEGRDRPEKLENPTYSFYQGLKETEVVVDAVPISVELEHAYYIHAGSFGSEAVALKEQRRLARLGQAVDLSPLHSKGKTYYRLRVGPFHDRLEMNRKRNELRQLGVDTLLVRAPKN
ncbi:SPOR domain-containing protein [Thiomicrorhabdus sp. zzn3]|uniref:SPOR domain-containing protein n=1 Tax=Thiomicrorhabdus sp. zzn3 TaxID=3039775 RepID=UPI002436A948|nr:SPOR domain-containing protein [Thiomicrorhabdus sp. zzn3]MDG6778950.1 SPOR domain-containing protein [Thiomicrorhabdus sp. zzn3]